MLLMTPGELGQLVFDAADLAQPQDRPCADHQALGFEDAAGESSHRHGEAHAARAQRIDGMLHVAGGVRLEPAAEGEHAGIRRAHQRGIADDFGLVGGRVPCHQDLRLGKKQRVGAVDRGFGGDGLVARRRLDLGQAPARAHEQDRGDDGEAKHAERERERGDLVAIEQRKRRDVGVKRREFVARARRLGAGAAARQQRRQNDRAGGAQSALARPCARAGTRVVLRMSPNALHGDPDRLRHSRLPHCRIYRRSCDAGSRTARRSASFRRTAANRATLPPTGIAPEVGQIVNKANIDSPIRHPRA
jgi:hypothetical protein